MAHDNQEKTTRECELEAENESLKQELENYTLILDGFKKKDFEQDLELFQLRLECGKIPGLVLQRREAQQQLAEKTDDFRMKEAGYEAEIAYLRQQLWFAQQDPPDAGESKIHTVQTHGDFFKPATKKTKNGAKNAKKKGQKHEVNLDEPVSPSMGRRLKRVAH